GGCDRTATRPGPAGDGRRRDCGQAERRQTEAQPPIARTTGEEQAMRGLRFPIAVAATSLALVAVVAVAGGLVAREVLAGGPWFGGHGFGAGLKLPPAIAGLGELPPEERFAHFRGAQVSLTDKDDQPLTITVT